MDQRQANSQKLVWWVLWAAFQVSPIFYYNLLATPASRSASGQGDSSLWVARIAPFILSAIIRWLILPRVKNAQPALTVFVMGIALAEATCFIGIFLVSGHALPFFILSLIGIFQFMPWYVGRFFQADV